MRVHVNTVLETDTILHAIRIFELYQQRILPVLDKKGIVCGIISARELSQHVLATTGIDGQVSEIMRSRFHSVPPEAELSDLQLAYIASDDDGVLVVDERRKLIGLVTDVAMAAARLTKPHD